jgi:hypothetical protein
MRNFPLFPLSSIKGVIIYRWQQNPVVEYADKPIRNFYNEEDEFMTWCIMVVLAVMALIVMICAGLRGEQRPSPKELKSKMWAKSGYPKNNYPRL